MMYENKPFVYKVCSPTSNDILSFHSMSFPTMKPSQKQSIETSRLFICPNKDCGRQFNRAFSLKRHLRVHTGEMPFKCSFPGCQSAFNVSGNLRRHEKIHTTKLNSREFSATIGTRTNICTHSPSKPSSFDLISTNFPHRTTSYFAMNSTANSCMDKTIQRWVCNHPNCGKNYVYKRSWETHMRQYHPQSGTKATTIGKIGFQDLEQLEPVPFFNQLPSASSSVSFTPEDVENFLNLLS